MGELINKTNLFLTVLEGGKSKIKVLIGSWLVSVHFLVNRWQSSDMDGRRNEVAF